MGALDIPPSAVERLLGSLFGKSVEVVETDRLELHVESIRGLITNENELVGAVAGDLQFVASSGAALALMPRVEVEEMAGESGEQILEFYGEVANVMSRLVNDHGGERVRIDPDIDHSTKDLGLVIGAADCAVYETTIEGYGNGVVGVWSCL